ncbi:MAG: tetratricopeptide repeat protein [Kordiimonadaceae bacterium]|jgi:tetratricopeptide (TPR) repeat protein|nr:tetratricopeptide repeat protein [Kordiimonadaceae bacterium]MBT6037217.1 tetratricopeptide repeat protein [Kordiimonadaceae bacterium]MBT6328668.1 tetratricopeptide repeat protein [Kordiimonadaceae bacterium]
MQNFKTLTKTLLTATAITVISATASILPTVADFTGQEAFAQTSTMASEERAAEALAARIARPRIGSMPGMNERAFKTLTKVQEFMELEPPQYGEAMLLLKKQNLERLNSTELTSFYQLMAAVAQNQDNIDEALGYYKNILAMESISYAQRDQMTFIVGQIEFSNGNNELAISYFEDWLKYQPTPSITNIVVLANVYYASALDLEDIPVAAEKYFRNSIEFLNWAIIKAKADGKEDKENWYAVLRAIHNNLEEIDKVVFYGELLATRWPKKEYWTQLSGLYSQAASEDGISEEDALLLEKKQFATFDLAFRQGMLDSARELETMSQLFLYHESPYQAAKTMSKSIEDGVSEKSQRNLELQATAHINGKDMADAVAPLTQAADMSDDGNLYMRLANVYLNLDEYEEAAAAIEKALTKGGLRRADQSSLLQGQAYLALEKFDDARNSFREAAKDERSETMARNLLRYVDAEERRIKDIREYLS